MQLDIVSWTAFVYTSANWPIITRVSFTLYCKTKSEFPSASEYQDWHVMNHYNDVIMRPMSFLDCLLRGLFRRRSKKTSKPRVIDLCEGNPPVTGVLPSQRTSNAEMFSIWWRHHDMQCWVEMLRSRNFGTSLYHWRMSSNKHLASVLVPGF